MPRTRDAACMRPSAGSSGAGYMAIGPALRDLEDGLCPRMARSPTNPLHHVPSWLSQSVVDARVCNWRQISPSESAAATNDGLRVRTVSPGRSGGVPMTLTERVPHLKPTTTAGVKLEIRKRALQHGLASHRQWRLPARRSIWSDVGRRGFPTHVG